MQDNRKISTQFVHAVGFSKGCAELALKNPPPLVPSSLMASWLATGPPVMVCCPPARVVATCVCRSQFWMVPPMIRMSAPITESGNRIRMEPRTRSTQKLPRSVRVATGQTAHEGHRHGHADGGGDEVLHGQAGHLHEVALGRLTRIGLPVGVGHETHGRVPGQRRGHLSARVVEVQRQRALHQLKDEQEQQADRREGQHAAGVGAPGLFGLRVGADQPVDEALTTQMPFGGIDPVHVVAQRHVDDREADDEGDEEEDPCSGGTHLEPLREEQGGEEEHRDEDRQHEADDVDDHSPSTNF